MLKRISVRPRRYRRQHERQTRLHHRRIDISGNVRETVMLDLQAPDGPVKLESSTVLAGARPAFVLEALAPAIRQDGFPTPAGGWGGIRTHGGLAPTPVFKTGAFNRSATHPAGRAGLAPAPCSSRAILLG